MRALLKSFWLGLSTASLGSTLGIVGFALAEFGACCLFVTPRTISRLDPELLMETPRDDCARVTVEALKLRYEPQPGYSIAYIGSSVARMAIEESMHDSIAQYVAARVGEPVHFVALYTDNEALEEELAVIDQLPDGFRGVFVIPIADKRNDGLREMAKQTGSSFYRYAMYSPSMAARLREMGETVPSSGVYFLDFLKFFASRRGAAVRLTLTDARIGGPVQRHLGDYWSNLDRKAEAERPEFAKHEAMLEVLIEALRKKAVQVVLLEAPLNPRYEALKPEVRAEYEVRIREFARRIDVPYWDLNPIVAPVPDEFFDALHLLDHDARVRWQKAFQARIAELILAEKASAAAGASPATDSSRP